MIHMLQLVSSRLTEWYTCMDELPTDDPDRQKKESEIEWSYVYIRRLCMIRETPQKEE